MPGRDRYLDGLLGVLALARVYVVSSRYHLIDPIRPTRGHIAISLHGRLIRDVFAVRERLSDPRVVPSFRCNNRGRDILLQAGPTLTKPGTPSTITFFTKAISETVRSALGLGKHVVNPS